MLVPVMPRRMSRRPAPVGSATRWSIVPSWIVPLVLTLLAVLVGLITVAHDVVHALSYPDYGDGIYLYSAWRVAHGVPLYRVAMGVQPPVIYLLGALLFKLGATLPAIRLASGVLRIGQIAATAWIAYTMTRHRIHATLAALIAAALPIGLYWSRCFDVNPPLTFAATLSVIPLLRLTGRGALLAGVFAGVALLTKVLYAPLLLTIVVFLLVHERRLLLPFASGVIATLAAGCAGVTALCGSHALHDAYLGQGPSALAPAWFLWSLVYVSSNDGCVLVLAAFGALLLFRMAKPVERVARMARFAPYYLLGSSAVLLATVKEGTAGTVFQFAEPALAVCASYALVAIRRRPGWIHPSQPVRLVLLAFGLAGLFGVVSADRAALAWQNDSSVRDVAALIRAHVRPGQTILAPPYYVLLTGTRYPGDQNDAYIMARRVLRGDGAARAWQRTVVQAILERRYPVVVVDTHLALFTPLRHALAQAYRPVYTDALPPALRSTVWLPRGY